MEARNELKNDFCVLIISYGRPDKCTTAEWLEKMNYSRPWYVVCSTDDAKLDGYKKRYGERVIVFNKDEIFFDKLDNFGLKKVGSYARQACFPIARNLGYRFFVSLDDDYHGLFWRYLNRKLNKLCTRKCTHLDGMFAAMFQFIDVSDSILELDFGVDGLFCGGASSKNVYSDLILKGFNSHFNDVEKWIEYKGTFFDDMNACIGEGVRGRIIFTVPLASMRVEKFGEGVMSKSYNDVGMINVAFYSLMLCPSAVTIRLGGNMKSQLIVNNNNVFPKIINEKWHKK